MLSAIAPHPILMSIPYDVITATVAATMAGNEFAVAAFVHPQLYKLNEASHASAAIPFARILGKYMPFWYALALIMMLGATYEHRPISQGPGLLIGIASAIWAATIIFTIAMLVPINNRIAAMDPGNPYPGWQLDRKRWDRLHRIRVALLLLAVILLLSGLQTSTG
jgi:hypothetical protein